MIFAQVVPAGAPYFILTTGFAPVISTKALSPKTVPASAGMVRKLVAAGIFVNWTTISGVAPSLSVSIVSRSAATTSLRVIAMSTCRPASSWISEPSTSSSVATLVVILISMESLLDPE